MREDLVVAEELVNIARLLDSGELLDVTGSTIKYHAPHKEVVIGIGKDHTATLTLSDDALNVLSDKLRKMASEAMLNEMKDYKIASEVNIAGELIKIASTLPSQLQIGDACLLRVGGELDEMGKRLYKGDNIH
jgi:hypothetical protein